MTANDIFSANRHINRNKPIQNYTGTAIIVPQVCTEYPKQVRVQSARYTLPHSA